MALESLKKNCVSLHSDIDVITNDVDYPLSRERCDLMTYRYPLDKDSLNSGFFYDCYAQDVIATRRMNEHD
jgi:hypothetical protein